VAGDLEAEHRDVIDLAQAPLHVAVGRDAPDERQGYHHVAAMRIRRGHRRSRRFRRWVECRPAAGASASASGAAEDRPDRAALGALSGRSWRRPSNGSSPELERDRRVIEEKNAADKRECRAQVESGSTRRIDSTHVHLSAICRTGKDSARPQRPGLGCGAGAAYHRRRPQPVRLSPFPNVFP